MTKTKNETLKFDLNAAKELLSYTYTEAGVKPKVADDRYRELLDAYNENVREGN